MINKSVITVAFIFMMVNATVHAEESVIPATIYDSIYPEYPNDKETLVLGKIFKSQFTNSGIEEFIAFYYSKKKENPPLYEKIIIYVVKGKDIVQRYSITESRLSQYSTKFDLPAIMGIESILGMWNGYYYSYDFNKNGRNEIILFTTAMGGYLGISIYEFQNGRFVSLLPEVVGGYQLNRISVNLQEKSFTLYSGYEYEAHKKGFRGTTFTWNSQKGKYEIVKNEEGVFPKK